MFGVRMLWRGSTLPVSLSGCSSSSSPHCLALLHDLAICLGCITATWVGRGLRPRHADLAHGVDFGHGGDLGHGSDFGHGVEAGHVGGHRSWRGFRARGDLGHGAHAGADFGHAHATPACRTSATPLTTGGHEVAHGANAGHAGVQGRAGTRGRRLATESDDHHGVSHVVRRRWVHPHTSTGCSCR